MREAAATGASTLTDGIAAIDRALAMDASASLRPGRGDAVRVMNLHQAKGLEAPVVILAAPVRLKEHEPVLHVSRSTDGAEGGIAVYDSGDRLLAHPPGWSLMQAEEANFLAAEMDRLRYVAATRASRQLLIGQLTKDGVLADESAWAPFAEALATHATPLTMVATPAAGRQALGRAPAEIEAAIAVTEGRMQIARRAGFHQRAVTQLVKEERSRWAERSERTHYDLAPPAESRGRAWGTVVHRAIEAIGRGRAGVSLRRFISALFQTELPDLTTAEREQRVAEVEGFLAEVASLPEWASRVAIELGVMRVEVTDGVEEIEEGIVDLLTRNGTAYQVIDWKTDGAGFEERRPKYEAQVARYTAMLRGLKHAVIEGRLHSLH
jgi:ATP-dependent helicase/nuclease subunit A